MRASAVAIALFVLMSGCASSSGSPTGTVTPSTSAATASAKADLGSLTGVVTDEEAVPIPGVKVALVEALVETQTDPAGRFTFNDLDAGPVRVIFGRLGYESHARRVEIRQGEVTDLNVVLKSVVPLGNPYTRTHPGSVFIHFDWWYTTSYFSPVSDVGCERRCQIHHATEPKPAGGMVEVAWTPPVSAPLVAASHIVQVYPRGENGSISPTSTDGVVFVELGNRQGHVFTEAQTKIFAKADRTLTHVGAGFQSVSVMQRVDLWLSFGYIEPLPENFTALPPKP